MDVETESGGGRQKLDISRSEQASYGFWFAFLAVCFCDGWIYCGVEVLIRVRIGCYKKMRLLL
jgi:hypothetical protein